VNLQQDQRTHNLPTAEEIAVIIPEEGVHHAMDNRDIVMNIEWDYNYYQPWSDNEWLVDEMLAMLDEDIIMQ